MALRHDRLPRVAQRILTKKERVIVSTRRHMACLAEPLALVLVYPLFASWISLAFPEFGPLLGLIWLIWVVLIGRLAWFVFRWSRHCFVVTNERFIVVSGGFTQSTTQIPLSKGGDITLSQNLIGQLLGFGTFVLEGRKDIPISEIPWLPEPEKLHRRISRMTQDKSGNNRAQHGDTVPFHHHHHDDDEDNGVFVDASSRSTLEKVDRVHREAGDTQPRATERGPGLLSMWKGIVRPISAVVAPPQKRRRRPGFRRRKRQPTLGTTNVTTYGKDPQPDSIIREL